VPDEIPDTYEWLAGKEVDGSGRGVFQCTVPESPGVTEKNAQNCRGNMFQIPDSKPGLHEYKARVLTPT
jgi:hypothetical protein